MSQEEALNKNPASMSPPSPSSAHRFDNSSGSESGPPIDIDFSDSKFSKFRSEFSRMRSRLELLRKAYEYEKVKVHKAEDEVKQREQDIRKLGQDIESLEFRNIQLTARISVLQRELDESSAKSRSFFNFSGDNSATKQRSQSNASNTSVPVSGNELHDDERLFQKLNEQLKNTMIENDKLKTDITALECKLEEERFISSKQLQKAQTQAEKTIDEMKKRIDQLNETVKKYKDEKIELECNFNNFKKKSEHQERLLTNQIIELKEQLRMTMNDLSPANSLGSLSDSLQRSGSFSGDVHNRLQPGLPPRSGSLSIQNRSKRYKPSSVGYSTTMNCIPSHSSGSYKNEKLRNQVLNEFSEKLHDLICALSTFHTHLSKKFSYMFAALNNGEFHVYFDLNNSANSLQNKNILRQLSQSLQCGYDTPLIHLGESIKSYVQTWKKTFDQMDKEQEIKITNDLQKYSNEIIKEFGDYVDYIKKIAPLASLCLLNWSKTLRAFNSVREPNIPEEVYRSLCSNEKRFDLIQQHESLSAIVQDFVQILAQIFGTVKLLLTRSLSSDRILTTFNQCMHRIGKFDRFHDAFRESIATKYGLEHELNITSRKDFLDNDDCLLSALVFIKSTVSDIRVLLEVHYFFFVCPISPLQAQANNGSRMAAPANPIQNPSIPEEDDVQEAEEAEPTNLVMEVDYLIQEKEKYTLELEHKTLLLEREAQRISELELKIQELKTQLDDRKDAKSKPLSSTSSDSASNMNECFDIEYPRSEMDNGQAKLKTLMNELKLDDPNGMDEYWREQFAMILASLDESCQKLASSEVECASLRELYHQLDASRAELEKSLKLNNIKLTDTQEQFDTSVKNYQAQLQALTEHLALQKETIEAQREQIDNLHVDNDAQNDNPSSLKSTSASSFVSKAFSGFKKS